jgi:aspartyl-tRNA(Asn)/glutamyl-tRNA(Gln) amidotransferase subunit C
MPSPHIDIHHVARLARIALSDDEAAAFGAELDRMLAWFDAVAAVDLGPGEADAGPPPEPTPLRADVPGEPLPRELALSEAPSHDGAAFLVPKVV